MIIAAVQVFFLLLVNFAAHPFAHACRAHCPPDGNGLNPLLQYPEMVIHPPMLYLGYVGFTVPFAFALGALIMRYPGEKWIHITRRWTMVTWVLPDLSASSWARTGRTRCWAGAATGDGIRWRMRRCMPWLTGTAFLHSVMMQEKRGMLKIWNMWLIFTTFMLSIFGTFLTRSGRGQFGARLRAVVDRRLVRRVPGHHFRDLRLLLRQEPRRTCAASTNWNRWSRASRVSCSTTCCLLVACFTVLWGTLFPVLSEWVQGNKVTVGPPFFNRVNIPVALLLLLLTGSGPAAGLAQDLAGKPEAQLPVAGAGRCWQSESR